MAIAAPSPSSSNFFEDENFQDGLTKLLLQDVTALKQCGLLLSAEDFKPRPRMQWGRPRWLIADRALAYFSRHHEPIDRLIRADILDYGRQIGLSARQIQEAEAYLKHLRKLPSQSPEAITEKVLRFKQELRQASALEELNDLQSSGALTAEKWAEVTQKVALSSGRVLVSDYFETLDARIERRKLQQHAPKAPLFGIDPLDSLVKGVAPGQLGCVLAPYSRGKSTMLLHMALAFTLQRLNVLYFTLEDPLKELEDRLDAATSRLQTNKLSSTPKLLQHRFHRYRRLIHSRLHIVDGTEGMSVPQMEQIILQRRQEGTATHVVIVDYDDEVIATTKQKERRFELADIYRSMRRAAAHYNNIWWTAAQTQRGTESMKILSGDRVSEDLSKMRKVSMCISIGKGDWEPESFYLWVARHKFDRQHVGCHIVPDLARNLIYDADKTRKAMAQNVAAEEPEDELVAI